MGPEGYPPEDYWLGSHALLEDCASPCQERLPHGHCYACLCLSRCILAYRKGLDVLVMYG